MLELTQLRSPNTSEPGPSDICAIGEVMNEILCFAELTQQRRTTNSSFEGCRGYHRSRHYYYEGIVDRHKRKEQNWDSGTEPESEPETGQGLVGLYVVVQDKRQLPYRN